MMQKRNLVNIQKINPKIRIFLPYATENNFTGKKVYEKGNVCFVLKEVAAKLDRVQKKLESLEFGLLVWDGYRPLSVQRKFWELFPDENYVANPAKGGRHNRGTAVDVTLVTLDGKEVEMPTKFDDFSEQAHRNYTNLPDHIIQHRNLLERLMHEEGFEGWKNEWWHFDLRGWEDYQPLDIAIEELENT